MTELPTKGFFPGSRLTQELERDVGNSVGELSRSTLFEGQFVPGQSVVSEPLEVRQAVSGTGQAISTGTSGINPLGTAIGLSAGVYALSGSIYAQNSSGGELSLTISINGAPIASANDDAPASTDRRLSFNRTIEVRTGEAQLTFTTDSNGLDVNSNVNDHFFTIYRVRNDG